MYNLYGQSMGIPARVNSIHIAEGMGQARGKVQKWLSPDNDIHKKSISKDVFKGFSAQEMAAARGHATISKIAKAAAVSKVKGTYDTEAVRLSDPSREMSECRQEPLGKMYNTYSKSYDAVQKLDRKASYVSNYKDTVSEIAKPFQKNDPGIEKYNQTVAELNQGHANDEKNGIPLAPELRKKFAMMDRRLREEGAPLLPGSLAARSVPNPDLKLTSRQALAYTRFPKHTLYSEEQIQKQTYNKVCPLFDSGPLAESVNNARWLKWDKEHLAKYRIKPFEKKGCFVSSLKPY